MAYGKEQSTRYAPPDDADRVDRPKLVKLLDHTHAAAIVLIEAPAGYGKTTTIATWFKRLHEKGQDPAWVTLKPEDDDPSELLAVLATGVNASPRDVKAAQKEIENLKSANLSSERVIDRSIFRSSCRRFFFIDDIDHISSPKTIELLNKFIELSKNRIRLFLAGRSLDHLLVSKKKLSTEVHVVGVNELKMTESEAISFFKSNDSQSWSREFVSNVIAHTDGWIMALKAMKLKFSGKPPENKAGAASLGTTFALQDYIAEEVLEKIPPDLREFLLHISIVDEVNGDLANALCENGEGWGLLERINRLNLFVTTVDARHHWYRLHDLFRETLLSRLRYRFDALKIAALHERAARWCWREGRRKKAIQHAVKSGCPDLAAEWLTNLGGWRMCLRDNADLLRAAHDSLPEEIFYSSPSLFMGLIYLELKRGEIAKARHLFDEMKIRSDGFISWPEKKDQSDFGDEALIMDVYIASYENAVIDHEKIDRLRIVQASVAGEDRTLGAFVDDILCFRLAESGDFPSALSTGERALRYFLASDSTYAACFLRLLNGRALFALGRLNEAENELHICANEMEKAAGPEASIIATSHIFRAQIYYERNELEQAGKSLALAEPIGIETDNWYDSFETYFVTKLSLLHPTADQATPVFEAAEEIAIYRNLPALRTRMQLRRLRNALVYGEVRAAHEIAIEVSDMAALENASRVLTSRINASCAIGLYRYQTAVGDFDDVLPKLDNAIIEASQSRWFVMLTKLRVLKAAACWNVGDRDQALNILDHAVEQSLFENFRRLFVDEFFLITPVLEAAVSRQIGHQTNRLRDARLNELHTLAKKEAAQLKKHSMRSDSLLTEKEREIAPLLGQGMSNKEIARHMGVTENAIKYHLKNLFNKLEVGSRQDAVISLKTIGVL